MKIAILLLLFLFIGFMLGFVLGVDLWQLEMIYIAPDTWGYDFGGFGDLGLPLYKWRDFWYIMIFAVFIGVFMACGWIVYRATKGKPEEWTIKR